MATASRKPKSSRGGAAPESGPRRASAWSSPRASPAFSAGSSSPRAAHSPSPTNQGSFPPLGTAQGQAQPNGTRQPQPQPPSAVDNPQDRVLQALAGLTGTTITLSTKTALRYEGVVISTNAEGDTTGITLKDVKELTNPGAPLKEQLFIASTNIDTWASGPADAKLPNGIGDNFRTDADITHKGASRRDRELQAWQAAGTDAPTAPAPPAHGQAQGDDVTFGPGATNMSWDQFAVNEQLFGVTASFDEEVYTTKLDRSAADFREREKKAQKIANEIIGATTSNVHIAEERNMIVDDTGLDEEQKYGAVVRGANAYVPPAARKNAPLAASATVPTKQEAPKAAAVNGPETVARTATPTVASNGHSPAPVSTPAAPHTPNSNKPPADPIPAFRDFVTNERQRLTQKRQALVKSEMDKRMAELVKFSQSFKLNKPIPDDLVPILAKDEERQKQIKEKTVKDAASSQARTIGVSAMTTSTPGARAAPLIPASAVKAAEANQKQRTLASPGVTPKPAPAPPTKSSTSVPAVPKTGKPGINMFIQPIPPFKGSKSRPPASTPSSSNNVPTMAGQPSGATSTPPSSTVAPPTGSSSGVAAPPANNNNNNNNNQNNNINRLNINASSFKPGKTFTPSGNSPHSVAAPLSPKPKAADPPPTPNPFFGPRVIKRSPAVNIKDDFNPFRHGKVGDAAIVSATWPYNGKRHMTMFPPTQHPVPQHHSPHLVPPMPPPMPPPSYEEDSAAQAAARGYVYAYPPYGYPGQPMMPGMGPPGPQGGYMPGPFMQPMPYPPGMPPPNGQPMYAPGMGQMPPPQAYMPPPPPPGNYPPPNGAGPRPSMPPTPIPAHAHPYYHQSPQLQHAVPYPMMMPPPAPNVPPHPYETGPAPPVSMGGVGHG